MSMRAWVYLWSVLLVGALLAGIALAELARLTIDWMTFVPLLLLATLVQLFEAEAPNRQLLYLHFIFFFAALILLPAPLFVLVAAVPHLIEWAKVRWLTPESPHLREWYLQPFNVCNHWIAGSVALGVLRVGAQATLPSETTRVLFYVAAALTYVVINHLLVGLALQLARGISLHDSGVLAVQSLLPDAIMAGLGCVVASLWVLNPAWIVLALSPVVMMYQSLMVPQLTEEAQTDNKSGLLNARYFQKALEREFKRAQHAGQPMALIMADLDYLRNINNTYGHLAGDVVIGGIGAIIRRSVREGDSAGRFGGEEFAIVLPGSDRQAAETVAERIRQSIEAAAFDVPHLAAPIRATISLGVACFPDDGASIPELNLAADVAVYQAKGQGRNRVVCAGDVPEAVAHGLPTQAANQGEPVAMAAPRAVAAQGPQRDAGVGRRMRTPASLPTLPKAASRQPSPWLRPFVAATIGSGLLVALVGSLVATPGDPWLILGLALIALLFEQLQVSFNGQNTISVSVAIAVTAALLGGFSAVVAVSGAIALAHTLRQRPPIYKFLFNWASHLLAGALLAVAGALLPVQSTLAQLWQLGLLILTGMPIYFLIDVGLIAVAVSLTSGQQLRSLWRNEFGWLFSHYLVLGIIGGFIAVAYQLLGPVGIALAIVPLFMARYAQQQYVLHTQESMRELRRVNQELQQVNREMQQANATISQLNHTLVELNDEVVEALARLFDARDPHAGTHVAQVALYATLIGRELGLKGERLKHLRWAAFLHDIGKIAIPEVLLTKPGRLTCAEYEQIKTHAALGAELLTQSPVTRPLAGFVRQHHERWDGRGYPDGLAGEAITLEARILNLCDSVEAMASDRPYSVGRTPEEVVAEVRACAGGQFDPQVAAIFLGLVERHGCRLLVNTATEPALQAA